jgi:uncharacterized protein YhaN
MMQKDRVDAVMRRMDGIREERQALVEQAREAEQETERLQDHVDGVFERAGLPGSLPDTDRLEHLQAGLAQVQADRARLAENGMRLEALGSERLSLERLLTPGEGEPAEPVSCSGQEMADLKEQVEESENFPSPVMKEIRDQASRARARLPVLQEELDAVAEELSAARTTLATLETRLERIPREDRLQQVLEELDRLSVRRDALIRYGDALQMALVELRAAARKVQQGVSPRLDAYAGEMLQQLSSGRYCRIGTDDQLTVRVEVPQNGEMPSVSSLSGGTADQVWLAVRMAAIRVLEQGGETLPLFLDEPFAQYDEARTKAALSWLRELARDRQIFLFTCRERDMRMACDVFTEAERTLHPLDDVEAVSSAMV